VCSKTKVARLLKLLKCGVEVKQKKVEEERSVNYFFCIFVEVAAYSKRYQNKKHRIAYIDRTVHFFFISSSFQALVVVVVVFYKNKIFMKNSVE